ncbi:MAG: DUF2179 domain-containing protein [Candidatus Cyclobacteriaceae bacterium M2_1C_046]
MEDSTLFYILLPLFIFFARVLDVSINTIRIIYVLAGKKYMATILGFFESLIWLLAIRQIFEHLDNVYSYIAYPAGFACGILVGMKIEERIALGKVVVRIISSEDMGPFKEHLIANNMRFSLINSQGIKGPETILFTVVKREELSEVENIIKKDIPHAFYTVEGIKSASESGLLIEQPTRRGIGSWLSSVKRK